MPLDFKGLASSLLAEAKSRLSDWFPNGKAKGAEYVVGSLSGEAGESLSINTRTGAWCDFAHPDVKGGDLISLYAAKHGLSQGDAFKALMPGPRYLAPLNPAVNQLTKPPSEEPKPPMLHPDYGEPSASWRYADADGSALFYVARYNMPTCSKCGSVGVDKRCEKCGSKCKKQIIPWSWRNGKWVMKGWEAPRPLYGLDSLISGRTVLIVEGEGKAEAARRMLDDKLNVVSWPNGASSPEKADWSPIYDYKVIIWPDADEVGVRAAYRIGSLLTGKCPEVKIVGIEGYADGWDVGDAVGEGWDWDKFYDWVVPRLKEYSTPVYSPPPIEHKTQELKVTVQTEDQEPLPSKYTAIDEYGLAKSGNGTPLCNMDNVLRIFERKKEFCDSIAFDDFHKKYYRRDSSGWTEWSEIDTLRMAASFQRDYFLSRCSPEMVQDAMNIIAHDKKKNEPRDWMSSLKWDGEKRVESFFIEYFGTELNNYTAAVSKNWWISMVARVFKPGVKVDNMLILEGDQGQFKSTALKIIADPWYTESHYAIGSPDFYQGIQGKLIIEFADLESFGRAETNTIKKVVSCATDRFRLPYARTTKDFPRQCVFVGTTNEGAYLKDNTGGRRFWPILVTRIKLEAIRRDRDQLFAEALVLFNAGETWWETPMEVTKAVQESRRQMDEWEPMIGRYMAAHSNGHGVAIEEIARLALGVEVERLDTRVQNRIASALRHQGYKNVREDIDGVLVRVWKKET